ncbi:hypothetical protein HDK77DRAFT_449606 [Phyllosticta capitalensis]
MVATSEAALVAISVAAPISLIATSFVCLRPNGADFLHLYDTFIRRLLRSVVIGSMLSGGKSSGARLLDPQLSPAWKVDLSRALQVLHNFTAQLLPSPSGFHIVKERNVELVVDGLRNGLLGLASVVEFQRT